MALLDRWLINSSISQLTAATTQYIYILLYTANDARFQTLFSNDERMCCTVANVLIAPSIAGNCSTSSVVIFLVRQWFSKNIKTLNALLIVGNYFVCRLIRKSPKTNNKQQNGRFWFLFGRRTIDESIKLMKLCFLIPFIKSILCALIVSQRNDQRNSKKITYLSSCYGTIIRKHVWNVLIWASRRCVWQQNRRCSPLRLSFHFYLNETLKCYAENLLEFE